MQEAVVVDCLRTAVGKAPRCILRNSRPDDLAAACIRTLLSKYPQVPKDEVDDVILGCAMPEAESGMNMAREAAWRAGRRQVQRGDRTIRGGNSDAKRREAARIENRFRSRRGPARRYQRGSAGQAEARISRQWHGDRG